MVTSGEAVRPLPSPCYPARYSHSSPCSTAYEHPANIVVAGFIGNPGMNVFKTEIQRLDSKQFAIRWGSHQLPLPLETSEKYSLQDFVGKSIYAGLRPEAIGFEVAPDGAASIQAEVVSIEALGHEYLIYFKSDVAALETNGFPAQGHNSGHKTLVARLPSKVDAKVAEKIELGFRSTKIIHGILDEEDWSSNQRKLASN